MLGHLVMHGGNRIRTIEILCEAKNVGIADVAIGFDQLTAEQIELRTSKRVHVDAPVLFCNKEIGHRYKIRSSGPGRTSRSLKSEVGAARLWEDRSYRPL